MKRLLACLLGFATAVQGAAPPDAQARFLAGLPVETTELEPLTREAAWQEHITACHRAWIDVEDRQLANLQLEIDDGMTADRQQDAAAHLCKIKTFLAGNLPPIEGDPIQIQQAVINLVRNAFDAMRDAPATVAKTPTPASDSASVSA